MVFACSAVAPAAADRFEVYNLRVLDRVTDLLPVDIDGDGLRDLVVLHTKGSPPEAERWMSIFWQRPEGGFSTAADLAWPLPDSIAAVDAADIHDDPGMELLALSPGGVSRILYGGSSRKPAFEPLISGLAGAILPAPDRAAVLDFAQDWNGDGCHDIAFLSLDELFFFMARPGPSFCDPQRVEIESRIGMEVDRDFIKPHHEAVSVSRDFPTFAPVDLEGDGDSDLVVHWDDQARFFVRVGGEIPRRPDSSVWLELLSEEEKEGGDFWLDVSITDVDGDGYADLYAGKSTREGVSDFLSSVVLYFGDGRLDFAGEPDWSTSVKGMSLGDWIDLDGDGRRELVLPVVSLGITDLVRILLTRKVKVEFQFYFVSPDRNIARNPDFIEEVTLEVGLDKGGEAQIIEFDGDYNGDGRKDMVVATGEEELSVYLGKEPSKGELFERKPEEKVKVGTFGSLRSLDLNGDGKDDMMVFYPERPGMSSHVGIVVNRGPW